MSATTHLHADNSELLNEPGNLRPSHVHSRFLNQEIPRLLDLAETQVENNQGSKAMETYREVQHIIHRNDGVYSRHQVPVLNRILNLYRQSGDYLAADREAEFSFTIGTRGKQPLEDQLLAFGTLAEHYLRRGHFTRTINIYESELDLLETIENNNPINYVQPLKGIADTAQTSRRYLKKGIRALVELTDRLSDMDIDQMDEFTIQIQMADLHLLNHDYKTAVKLYKAIWDSAEDTALLSPFFSDPTLIFPNRINTHFLRKQGSTRFLDITLSVNDRGKVSDFAIDNRNLPSWQLDKIHLWLKYNQFRPRMTAGELVACEGLTVADLLGSGARTL